MNSPPKVAVIVTEYRRNSHADVIAGRLLAGYDLNGQWQLPRLQVVSMYTDQVPDNDMSRDKAAQHGFAIVETIKEALTQGTDKLVVDGVVLIGEHGDYPRNEKGQKLYPRYELYHQVIEVFQDTGQTVPVFCDKHLSTQWSKALWMVEQSRHLGFPLLTGSVQTMSWRRPPLELALGTPVDKAVAYFHGPKEDYGIHALEVLQCMVERRAGGETGVDAVQCLEGPSVWAWTDANPWAEDLLQHALTRSDTCKPGSPRDNCAAPILFVLDYRSGLQGAAYILNGHLTDRGFAAQVVGVDEPLSAQFYAQPVRPFGHHSSTAHYIEEMMLTGHADWPAERTLLTTGALEALMDSSHRGNARLPTPHLQVQYTAPEASHFLRGSVPPEDAEKL